MTDKTAFTMSVGYEAGVVTCVTLNYADGDKVDLVSNQYFKMTQDALRSSRDMQKLYETRSDLLRDAFEQLLSETRKHSEFVSERSLDAQIDLADAALLAYKNSDPEIPF